MQELDHKQDVMWRRLCFLVLAVGLILRVLYAARVPYNISWHDLGDIAEEGKQTYGHLGYIQYLVRNLSLPEIKGQYYHPPLFYILAAPVYALFSRMEANPAAGMEAVQMLNTFFAQLAVLFGCALAGKLVRKGRTLFFVTVFLSFAPAFLHIGTSVNSDCLAAMFAAAALYAAACWYARPTVRGIVAVAFCLGLGVLSKINTIMLAPAIGAVFLEKLICQKEKRRSLWGQYAVFAVIAVPLCLFWPLYGMILYDIPIGYIPRLPDSNPQYIGYVSMIKRLFIPSAEEMKAVAIDFNRPSRFSNIPAQTVLTMVFDEGILRIPQDCAWGRIAGIGLLWGSAVLAVFQLVCSVLNLGKLSDSVKRAPVLLLIIVLCSILTSYLIFCIRFPHVCTMNFRYIVAGLPAAAVACGMYVENRRTWLRTLWESMTILCSAASAVLYVIFAV